MTLVTFRCQWRQVDAGFNQVRYPKKVLTTRDGQARSAEGHPPDRGWLLPARRQFVTLSYGLQRATWLLTDGDRIEVGQFDARTKGAGDSGGSTVGAKSPG